MKSLVTILESVILIALAALVFWYFGTGKLPFFVHPDYIGIIVASAAMMVLMGLLGLRRSSCCACGTHAHIISEKMSACVVLIPLLLGFLIEPKPLSAETALSRGIMNDVMSVEALLPEFSFSVSSEKRTLVDWVKAFNIDPEPENYAGTKVHFEGMVMQSDTLPENTFFIAKFFIACCAADARPVGIPVYYDPSVFTPRPNQWIDLEGEIVPGEVQGERRAFIQLDAFTEISVPDNPYIY